VADHRGARRVHRGGLHEPLPRGGGSCPEPRRLAGSSSITAIPCARSRNTPPNRSGAGATSPSAASRRTRSRSWSPESSGCRSTPDLRLDAHSLEHAHILVWTSADLIIANPAKNSIKMIASRSSSAVNRDIGSAHDTRTCRTPWSRR
jgi:hypothetical protein